MSLIRGSVARALIAGAFALLSGGCTPEKRPPPPSPGPSPAPRPTAARSPGAPSSSGSSSPSAPAPSPTPASPSTNAVAWTDADDTLSSAAQELAADFREKRTSLGARLVIDDSGPASNAFFERPDADAERAWRSFRADFRSAVGELAATSFVGASEPGATHLLTARFHETADRHFEVVVELVDMTESRVVWRAKKTGDLGR